MSTNTITSMLSFDGKTCADDYMLGTPFRTQFLKNTDIQMRYNKGRIGTFANPELMKLGIGSVLGLPLSDGSKTLNAITDYYGGEANSALLFVKFYFLETSLCFGEYTHVATNDPYNTGDHFATAKILMTRNAQIAARFLRDGSSVSSLAPLLPSGAVTNEDILSGNFSVFKISVKLSGEKSISVISLKDIFSAVSITPYAFLLATAKEVCRLALNSVVTFTYLKDNGSERSLDVTFCKDILLKNYPDMESDIRALPATLEAIADSVKGTLPFGYFTVPAINLPSDTKQPSFTRALSLTRITGWKAYKQTIVSPLANSNMLKIFIAGVKDLASVNNVKALQNIYRDVANVDIAPTIATNMAEMLISYAKEARASAGSTYDDFLCGYMQVRSYLFPGIIPLYASHTSDVHIAAKTVVSPVKSSAKDPLSGMKRTGNPRARAILPTI